MECCCRRLCATADVTLGVSEHGGCEPYKTPRPRPATVPCTVLSAVAVGVATRAFTRRRPIRSGPRQVAATQ